MDVPRQIAIDNTSDFLFTRITIDPLRSDPRFQKLGEEKQE